MAAEAIARGSTVVQADGTALVQLGPERAFESWIVSGYSIKLQGTGSLLARFELHQGTDVNGAGFLEGSYDGVLNSSDTKLELPPGERLSFYWTDATVGATALVMVRFRLAAV